MSNSNIYSRSLPGFACFLDIRGSADAWWCLLFFLWRGLLGLIKYCEHIVQQILTTLWISSAFPCWVMKTMNFSEATQLQSVDLEFSVDLPVLRAGVPSGLLSQAAIFTIFSKPYYGWCLSDCVCAYECAHMHAPVCLWGSWFCPLTL